MNICPLILAGAVCYRERPEQRQRSDFRGRDRQWRAPTTLAGRTSRERISLQRDWQLPENESSFGYTPGEQTLPPRIGHTWLNSESDPPPDLELPKAPEERADNRLCILP
jgi:hypothetical protein